MSGHPWPRAADRLLPRMRRGRPHPTGRRHSARGQALVERAIVLPVFLFVVGAAIDLGRLFQAYVTVENAAKEGAFFGATDPRCDVAKQGCADPNTVDWHVRAEAGPVSIDPPPATCPTSPMRTIPSSFASWRRSARSANR